MKSIIVNFMTQNRKTKAIESVTGFIVRVTMIIFYLYTVSHFLHLFVLLYIIFFYMFSWFYYVVF